MKFFQYILPLFFLISCGDSKPSATKTQDLDSLLVIYPDSVPLLIKRGTKMFKFSKFEAAMADGAKAFRLDSTNIDARMLYADVLNNRPGRSVADVAHAQDLYKVIVKKQPKNTKALVGLATTYSQQSDFDKSFQYINVALKIDPKYRDGYVLKGTNYLLLNKMDLAKSSYETAVQQDPKFFEAYLMLGSIYQSEKNEICLQYYTTAKELKPKNLEVLYALAYGNQIFNKVEEAKTIYREMLQQDSTYSQAYFQLGYIKQWLEPAKDDAAKEVHIDSAIYFYSGAVDLSPKYSEAWHNLGVCYLNRGEKSKATESLRRALKYNPEFELSKELLKSIK